MGENKKTMKYEEKEKLGPIEKYKKLGHFPWKLVAHILLVIFTICQCILILSYLTKFSRAQERGLYNIFIEGNDKTEVDYERKIYLFSVEEMKQHIRKSLIVTLINKFRIFKIIGTTL